MAQLYKVGEKPQTISPKNGRKFELEEVWDLIGGYVEMWELGHGAIMLWDEDGDPKGLSLNVEASRIAGFPVVGIAIVCARNQF